MPTAATAAELLTALSERLVAARTSPGLPSGTYQYPLNDQVLPAGDGSPDAVLATLTAALLPAGGATLAVTVSGDPVLSPGPPQQPDQLVLAGTSTVLTGPPVSTTVVFTVSAAGLLQATWTTTMPDGRSLADVFPVLGGSGFGAIGFTAASYIATSYGHTDPAVYFPLVAGLHFQGTLAVRADLQPALTATTPGAVTQVRVGGPLSVAADRRPQFSWTAEAPLPPLIIPLSPGRQLSLMSGVVALASAPASDQGGNQNELFINGTITVVGTAASCRLDLPTAVAGGLVLRASPFTPSAGTLCLVILQDLGLFDAPLEYLPEQLAQAYAIPVTAYSITFTPGQNLPVTTSATLAFGSGEWVVTDAVSVTDVTLALTAIRLPQDPPRQYRAARAEIHGSLRLQGGAGYEMRAVMTQDGITQGSLWYFEVTGHTAPSLDNLGGLGLSRPQVTGVMPPSLPGLAGLGVSRFALLADWNSQTLRRVDLTLAQTQPWPLAGGLVTLSGWTADLASAATGSGTWTTAGQLDGTVELTPGDSTTALRVSLPVPAGPGQPLTFELAGDPVRLPSIGQLLRLLGASPAALPAAFSSLGALEVRQFAVSFNPAAAAVTHVGFAVGQAGDWVIPFTADSVTVSGVAAALSFAPGTTPVGVSGRISGTLVLAGSRVDVSAIKNGYEGGWVLRAAVENYVHVPDFSALNSWLSPDKASSGVPATLGRPSGLDVGNLFIEFAEGPNGAPRRLGFTVRYAGQDRWEIVSGRLALTSIEADLTLALPATSTDAVSGTVGAVVGLAGVDLGVSASKPSPGAHWEFTGQLLAGLTFDFMTAVNSLTATARALPADAASHGLPATITVADVEVRAVPEDGLLHFSGSAGFDWPVSLGNASPVIASVSGAVDIPHSGGPLSAALAGTLTLASLQVRLSLAIGGAGQDTVLTGVLTTQVMQQLQLSDVTDRVAASSAAERWSAVVPADLTALWFASAAAYLNLTRSQFLLYGQMNAAGSPGASALAYLAGDGGNPAQWSYAVAVSFGPGFQFGALAPSLALIDQHLQVTQARLVVCNLRSGTLGGLAQTTTALLGSVDPGATAPLAGLTGDAQALATGAYVAAKVDISPVGGNTLLSRLVQIGSGTGPAALSVLALIDKAEPASTQFAADVPDITILDTITLTHTDSYPGIHLSYRPGADNTFTLDGRLEIDGVFEADHSFDVTLTVSNAGLTSTARQTQQTIPHPFELPGIDVTDLSVTVAYTWAVAARPQTSQFTITGKVLLGPAPAPGTRDSRLSCDTSLVLLSGSPALVDVAVSADLDIGAFLAQCVTGSGANWPTGFIGLTVAKDSRVYYHSVSADPGGTLSAWNGGSFGYGFHVDALLRLTLLTELNLHGDLTVQQDPATGAYTGITATVALENPLDLVFLSLAGSTAPSGGAPYAGGPSIGISTGGNPRFALDAGVNFLGAAFAVADISVARGPAGGTELDGQLTAAHELSPFGPLSFGFTYRTVPGTTSTGAPAERLSIHGWPQFTWDKDIFDFLQAIKSLADTSAGSPCGQLAGLVTSKVFHSSYSLAPSVSVSGANLVFSLSGSYQLTLAGMNTPFVTAALPAVTVPIPATTQLSALAGALADGIAGAAGQIAQGLLNDRENTAMLLAVLLGPQAVAVALELACNGLVDGAVSAAAEAAATVLEAGVTVAALGAALDAVRASLAQSGDDGNGAGIPAPRLTSAGYENGAVSATWTPARRASDYLLQVLDPDGSQRGQHDFPLATSGTIALDSAPLPDGVYPVQVRGQGGGATGPWSNSIGIVKPTAPVPVLGYNGTALTATWADAHMDGYLVRFTDPAGNAMGGDDSLPGSVRQDQRPLTDPVAGGYTVRLRAVRTGQFPGGWGAPAALSVVALAEPAITGVTDDGATLTVTWTPGTPAGPAYDVRLAAGGSLVAATSVTGAEATLNASSLRNGTTYTVQVRARGDNTVSLWSQREFTPAPVPAPASARLTDDAGSLIATWAAVPSGTYRAELIDTAAPTQAIGTLDAGSALAGTLTRTDGQPLTEGALYQVRVRANVGGNLSPWTTSAALRYVVPPPPAAPTLTAEGSVLTLTWQAPSAPPGLPTPLGYDGRLFQQGVLDPVGEFTAVTATTVAPKRTNELPPGVGEIYYAQVRTDAGPYLSTWALSDSVTIMDSVQIVSATYQGSLLTVEWTASEVPTADFEVEITPVSGDPAWTTVFPHSSGGLEPGDGQVDLTGRRTGGACSVRVRAVSPQSHGGWSTPARVLLLDPPHAPGAAYDGRWLSVGWFPVTDATGYRVTVTGPDGKVAVTQDTAAPAQTTAILAKPLARGITYIVTVAALLGADSSPPSPGTPATLLDPPSPVTAEYNLTGVSVSWPAVQGARDYTVAVTELGGRQVENLQGITETSVSFGGVEIVEGLGYLAQVAARADIPGPLSAPVPAVQSDFTCLCLGYPPGEAGCGGGGAGGNYAQVRLNIDRKDLSRRYVPGTPDSNFGWVGVPPGRISAISVTARLVALLNAKKTLQSNEAFLVFSGTRAATAKTLSGTGHLACLCMGTSPGGACGGGLPDPFGTVYRNVTQQELAERFQPPAPAARTGWVAVDVSQDYNPLEALLQLVTRLAAKKVLAGAEPYDVFNLATQSSFRAGAGGTTTCVALGSPIGQGCSSVPGKVGDVAINVSDQELQSSYRPGLASGWAAMSGQDDAVLSVVLGLVSRLFERQVLTGSEPYDIFTNAHAPGGK